ncbi:MAG: cupredoxin domain-containing protein [Solirubrobacterales bacterium]|jgi:hypothetical protein|nr:cupredoxin domain-containing protein [Solirubrobacterales bacterium]
MPRPRARLAALVVVALTVLAIGGGALVLRGEAALEARAQRGRIRITLDDFRLRPQRIQASPGRLTFELRNAGRLGHGFRLRRNNRLWLKIPTLKPGERRIVTRLLEPGNYRMFDAVSNYEVLGMYGTLSVR